MRPFLYALTFTLGLCLLLPTAARGRGVLGSHEPPPEPTKEEIQAQKDAERYSEYFIGTIAAVLALAVVVQFVREVNGCYVPVRIFTYSARTDSYDGTGSYDGTDSRDDYDSRYESEF